MTCAAADEAGNQVSCSFTVTVEDKEAPVIQCGASPNTLWPPNHKMVCVTIGGRITDNVDFEKKGAAFKLKLTSNEPDVGPGRGSGNFAGDTNGGDGYTAPVIVVGHTLDDEGNFSVMVYFRAERDGTECYHRAYAAAVCAADAAGMASECGAVVAVVHDQGAHDCGIPGCPLEQP